MAALEAGATAFGNRVGALEARNPTALVPLVFNAALAIDWDDGPMRSVNLSANTTITFSNVSAGGVLVLAAKQDATGGRTITWPNTVQWPSGSAEGPSSGGGDTDVFTLLALAPNQIIASALLDVS